MNNIYLVSYNGGSAGEFLCYQISKDPTYYDANLQYITETNRWVLANEFYNFGTGVKNGLAGLTPSIAKQFTNKFSEKHSTVPTHYYGPLDSIKNIIPNIKGIRFYFSHKMFPLFYSLLWIKCWSEKKIINYNNGMIENLKNLINFPYDAAEVYKSNLAWSKFYKFKEYIPKVTNIDQHINLIIDRGYFYSFEKHALANRLKDSKDLLDYNISKYLDMAMLHTPNYTMLNVGNLLIEPKNNVKEWQQVFDMSDPMDYREIEKYHQTNLSVIETTFNKPYEIFAHGDWISELKEWVNQTCPDTYC